MSALSRMKASVLGVEMFGRLWIPFKVIGLAAFQSSEGPFRYSWLSLASGYSLLISATSTLLYLTAELSRMNLASRFRKSNTAEVVIITDKSTLMIACTVCLVSGTFNTNNLFRVMTVLTLKGMFRNLNRKLNRNMSYRELGPNKILPLVDYVKEFPGTSCNKTVQGFDELRELSAVHWKLCVLGNDINQAFNGQLMAVFISLLVRIVTRPYFIFLSLEYTLVAVDPIQVVINSLWVVIYWMQLCLLVWSCSVTSNEAEETSNIIVHNINQPLPRENRKPMEMFLLQLGSHKLNFNVYHLFTIDLTVLTSVAGAVTTYLVILIQFQNSHP